MKNKISILTFLVTISALVVIWFACSKKETTGICSTCKPVLPEMKKELILDKQPFTISIYKKSPFPNFVISTISNPTEENSTSMKRIIDHIDDTKFFDSLLNNRFIPIGYSVYVRGDVHNETDISLSDIGGLSIFMYKDFGLHHFIFLKNEFDKFIITRQYSVVTDAINFNDQALIFEKVVNAIHSPDTFSLISTAVSPFNEVIKKVRTKGELNKVLRTQQNGFPGTGKLYPGDSTNDRCNPSVCIPIADETPSHCVQLMGGYGCAEKEDHCSLRAVSRAYSQWTAYTSMKDTFYFMRDSILANSAHGDTIINNYYTAGKYIYDNLDNGNIDLERMYSYVTLLYDKTRILLNNTTSNAVLIDNSTKNDLLDMIDDLRSLSADTEWQDCLDWMETMVTNFANVSAGDIYTYITT